MYLCFVLVNKYYMLEIYDGGRRVVGVYIFWGEMRCMVHGGGGVM